MPFQDVNDDETLSATTDGVSVGNTVTGSAANVRWQANPDTARENEDGTQVLEIGFANGTNIETGKGDQAIETLKVGDRVMTANGVYQKIRWIGSTKIKAKRIAQDETLRPVRIVAGALGHGLPKSDLLVSRQHRMLVSSEISYRMCGATDVLIPAIRLTALPGIFECNETNSVEYFHILFDDHEVIFAEGAPSESLFTGPEALERVPNLARIEILKLLPELKDGDFKPTPAAFIPKRKQQKSLVARHAKNGKLPLEGLY